MSHCLGVIAVETSEQFLAPGFEDNFLEKL